MRFVRVEADSVCSIAYEPAGTSPSATTSDPRVNANSPGEYLGVNPGAKIATVSNT